MVLVAGQGSRASSSYTFVLAVIYQLFRSVGRIGGVGIDVVSAARVVAEVIITAAC